MSSVAAHEPTMDPVCARVLDLLLGISRQVKVAVLVVLATALLAGCGSAHAAVQPDPNPARTAALAHLMRDTGATQAKIAKDEAEMCAKMTANDWSGPDLKAWYEQTYRPTPGQPHYYARLFDFIRGETGVDAIVDFAVTWDCPQ